jgi:hypothetical protein
MKSAYNSLAWPLPILIVSMAISAAGAQAGPLPAAGVQAGPLPAAGVQAGSLSNKGLAQGVPVPSWAASRRVHFFPAASSASRSSRGASSTGEIHNRLGRRCEPGYCPTPPLYNGSGSGVQHKPLVYLVFWGSNWNTLGISAREAVLKMFNGLNESQYQGILTQYYDTTGYISSKVAVVSYTDTGVGAPTNVNEASIPAEVERAVSVNHWTRSFDAQFVVMPAPKSTYQAGFGSGFCGYHSYDSYGSSFTFDPYIGDEPFYAGCHSYDPKSNVNNVTSMVASHEYAESATDPLLNEWHTTDGYEIGDICISGDDLLPDGAYAQGLWDNYQNACSLSDPGRVEEPQVFFADGSRSDTVSSWSWNTVTGYHPIYLGADAVAAGTSPAMLTINGTPNVLFVDANREDRLTDWTWTKAAGWQENPLETDPVAAGSSPSAVMVNGAAEVYFADAAASKTISVIIGSGASWQQSRFYGDPVAANSSPSAISNNGTAEVYFADAAKSNTVAVWVWGGTLQQSFFYGDAVTTNSSPSAVSYNGTPEVYFADAAKSNTMAVWVWGGTLQQSFFYGDALVAGSSPDATVKGGELQIYFADAAKSNTLAAWRWGSTLQETFFNGDGLAAGSTPSEIVTGSGVTQIYFADAATGSTVSLWEWGTSLKQIRLYGAPVMSLSSPIA